MSKRASKRAFVDTLLSVKQGIFQLSVLVLLISGVASVLMDSHLLLDSQDIFSRQEIYNRVLSVLGALLIGAVVLAALISFFVFLLKKRTAKTSSLRQSVAKAFIRGLENSSFNPHRLEDANERHSFKPAE